MARKTSPDKKKDQQRPSQMKFGDLLEQLVGPTRSGGEMPERLSSDGLSISPALLELEKSDAKDRDAAKKKRPSYASIEYNEMEGDLESSVDSLSKLMPGSDDDYDDTFDSLIEDAFREDEDVQFRNSLIAMGRKYAIKGIEEESENSEVNRSFVKQEQYIEMAIEELNRDASAIQRDLEMLRTSRTRSYKALSDLAGAKTSNIVAKLNAVKQLTDIQKAKYEITMKIKRERNDSSGDSGYAATQAVQKLLGVGRANLLGSEEYELTVSPEEPGNADYDDGRPESAIQRAMDIPEAVTDGDKFIQHENDGVEYVLDIDRESDNRQIYAINKHGEIVEDYPLPSNPDQLQFSINEIIGEATDQLQRRYRIRYNGEDVGDHAAAPMGTHSSDEESEN